MTKFIDWPLWLQLLVGIPHLLFAIAVGWFWWPTSWRGWCWCAAAFVYLCLFYVVFVR
jgi:hypothetical protein